VRVPASALIERGAADDEHRFGFEGDLDDLHFRLSVAGPFDRIEDRCAGGGLLNRFRMLLFHVRPGGELRFLLPDEGEAGGPRAKLLDYLTEVEALRSSGELHPPEVTRTDRRLSRVRDLHAFAASIDRLDVGVREVVAVHRADVRAKVAEHRMDSFLQARPDVGGVLKTVPASTWTARGAFLSSDPEEQPPETYSAPALSLREYHQAVVAPRQVLVHDHVVLPESFRNPVRDRLRSRTLVDWSKHFVQAPEVSPEPLPGTWFHLDNIMRGHFGHAMTEQLSHLWAWDEARARHPDLRALVFVWPEHPVAEWEYRLWEAAGVPRDLVTVLEVPVRVERLLAATPAYAIGPYVHPEIAGIYRRIGSSLAAAATMSDTPDRLFITRRSAKRACRNPDEVEDLFAKAGFTVVLPEEHDLPDQVAMVRGAGAIAGFAGSGMFHVALTDTPKPVLLVGSTTYPAANERQICAFHGHPLHIVRCTSDVVTDRFSEASFHSDFEFDMARHEPFVQAWLREL
jgi:hypothetical protein